jgi:folylpolyglutamate synthase/dihydropteroate synthase
MLSELSRMSARLIATRAASPRAVDPAEIASVATEFGLHCSIEPEPLDAVRAAIDQAGETLVCVTGSHYLVGEVRGYLLRTDRPMNWRTDA